MSRAAPAALLVLAACVAAPVPAPIPAGLGADAGGLQVVGNPLRIDFGRAQGGAIDAASRLLGAAPEAVVPCAGGIAADWAAGLRMVFEDGDFRGWAIDTPGIAAAGLTVGMAAADLPGAARRETDGGTAFDAGGVTAFVPGGRSRVSRLAAGAACGVPETGIP